jgi:hypothetical protein
LQLAEQKGKTGTRKMTKNGKRVKLTAVSMLHYIRLVALMLRWEITFYRYPERFAESTNGYLHCSNCTEKLCAHKNHLRKLWKQVAEYTEGRARKLSGKP